MAARISRSAYADMFGPTVGDKVRLADTDLIVEVEKDFTTYGEEVKFGGGKVIRDGMGQSQATRAEGAVDTVITNALILDHWGIVKADIGLKEGRIVAIGKAGNPDVQPGVDIVIGPATEAIAGEGKIVTAGGIDAHIHFICPQQVEDALMSGVTTLMGGGTGPAHGTLATTCTGTWHIGRMLQAAEGFPINIGIFGKGNAAHLEALAESGAEGVGVDWTVTLDEAARRTSGKVALQGNLDPAMLYGSPDAVRSQVRAVLDSYRAGNGGSREGHVFNLGHGMSPDMNPDHVAALVDEVHRYSAR